jgi:hypothetical protein
MERLLFRVDVFNPGASMPVAGIPSILYPFSISVALAISQLSSINDMPYHNKAQTPIRKA